MDFLDGVGARGRGLTKGVILFCFGCFGKGMVENV